MTVSLLLGGIGLFLIGMWMMTDGLKIAAGNTLQAMLRSATSSAPRGLLVGATITAIVQSSSAATIATIGFVNAGLLSLSQSVWMVFGANVGTTMTGWLVATIGIKVDVVALALPLLGIGMIARLVAGTRPRLSGLGQAIAGFGTFFLGIGFLQQGFETVSVPGDLIALGHSPLLGLAVFVLIGLALTILTQSSSAAMAIVLTASYGAGLPLVLSAAAVVGTNIGTTSTAAFAALSATPPAKRVAGAHIAFNVLTSSVALLLIHPLLWLCLWLIDMTGQAPDTVVTLALFHTVFNCLGLLIIWPLATSLVAWLERRFVDLEEQVGRPRHLDPTVRQVPQLALRGILLEIARMSHVAHRIARIGLTGGAAADPARLQGKLNGILNLGQAVRAFIEEMNREQMSSELAGAVPDLIRGVQHLEELASISVELSKDSVLRPRTDETEETQRMRQFFIENILASDGLVADPAETVDIDRVAADSERLYQALKTSLLQHSGDSRLGVVAMEWNLARIQQMRRCAEATWKARRRLERWFKYLERDGSAVTRQSTPQPAA